MADVTGCSAEDVVRSFRADEFAVGGGTDEQFAAEQGAAATVHNWRRRFGGMDTDAACELKELREQNTRSGEARRSRPTPG
ncbi:hypothetical protein AB4305_31855 [Nocardia sp. 2YAB30]|uniref:hypothetical protein n=1 Tax=Nocardia sp. 2YAB30 TaxID=3233022 RepID=UPI003F9CF544